MDQGVGAAARLPGSDRKDLAIQALAGSETVSDLAARHGVSRKFIYQQTHKARTVLDDAFLSATPDGEVLFELAVTKAWLRQVIVGLTLICRSAYRGVVEFLRDLLGVPISVGCVHDVLEAATRQANAINRDQDLSGIRVGLHDEIFQGATPVLAGVDAALTYCYLLAAEHRRDADTWGVHLLDAAEQGLRPDYTIADAGQGLRAGQRAAWGDTPCHGDVFHIQRQCEGLANTLARLAKGATSRRMALQARDRPRRPAGCRRRACRPAEAGPSYGGSGVMPRPRCPNARPVAGPRRSGPSRLGPGSASRAVRLHRRGTRGPRARGPTAHPPGAHRAAEPARSRACWQGWNRLRAQTGGKFHALFDAVRRAMADTPRSSSLVENLNSRLRTYFTLRRHLGGAYLDLLRFFLNHRRFLRSRHAERQGKSPRELMTGHGHPHWLTLLGLGPLQFKRA